MVGVRVFDGSEEGLTYLPSPSMNSPFKSEAYRQQYGYDPDTANTLVPMIKLSALQKLGRQKAFKRYSLNFHHNDGDDKKQPMEHALGVISLSIYHGALAVDTQPGRVVFRIVHEDHVAFQGDFYLGMGLACFASAFKAVREMVFRLPSNHADIQCWAVEETMTNMQALQDAGVLIPDGENPPRIDEYKYLLYLSHTDEDGELTCPLFTESKYHSGNPDVNGRTLNELINAVATSTNLYFFPAGTYSDEGDCGGDGVHTGADMRLVTEKLQSLQDTVALTTDICTTVLNVVRGLELRENESDIAASTPVHTTRVHYEGGPEGTLTYDSTKPKLSGHWQAQDNTRPTWPTDQYYDQPFWYKIVKVGGYDNFLQGEEGAAITTKMITSVENQKALLRAHKTHQVPLIGPHAPSRKNGGGGGGGKGAWGKETKTSELL
jgi:hypothetical protein